MMKLCNKEDTVLSDNIIDNKEVKDYLIRIGVDKLARYKYAQDDSTDRYIYKIAEFFKHDFI